MAAGLVCKQCGGTTFSREFHTASGDLACTSCGTVMEENPIVSEVTFAENAAGAATVQGSYVSNDQSHATFGNGRGSLESREQTIQNGKRRIRNVALSLNIPDHVSDSAHQWFKLALTNNFVQGRRSQNVIAACLYIACRKYNTHHMLIDFSSRLQVSVFAIGATFLKMVKALHITDLPLVDPSLFIQHFAEKLDFGKKTRKVVEDAKKLARRMSNDWIREGRRPASIAGACLLLAARMNNFRRTHLEIVAVTHISSQTLENRIREFKKTKSSNLTINELRSNKEVENVLPPSYQKGLVKSQKVLNELNELDNVEDKMINDPVLGALLEDSEINEDEIQSIIKKLMSRKKSELVRNVNQKVIYQDGINKLEIDKNDDLNLESFKMENNLKLNYESLNDTRDLIQQKDSELLKMIERNKPRNLSVSLPTTEEILKKIPDDDDELNKLIDDEELDMFILSKEESEMKERLWVGSNQDFLLEQEQKRLKLESDKIAGHTTQTRKRRKRGETENNEENNLPVGGGLANLMRATLSGNSTATDNAKALLNSKTLSKKINYNAVNNLFDD
ncbi:transcription factor TFIIIB subunit [Pichia kluyveri]|uniref:B-related factor 1 n=1 Tax=Pichia kluyveri TaxID=36015 RepID=A0AAV5R711_PICKL|nr:transcription factor TFIIIB subunit [Pichia kluyveri]